MSNKFADYVADLESRSSPEQREVLDAYGEHFELARQLLVIRREAGCSQVELAKKTGVQQSEISKIERGVGNPTQSTLEKLAKPFGRSLAFVPTPTRSAEPRAATNSR